MKHASRALALLLLLAATACAHVIHDAREPGVEPPIPTCSSMEPAQPPEVVRGEKAGLLFVQFTVESNGQVTDVKPGPFDAEPDPVLFAAARDYVSKCKWRPATQAGKAVAVHLSKGFGFYAPYLIDHAAPDAVEWTPALAKTLSAPKIFHCVPDDPRVLDSIDDARLTVVVQRDGHAGDLQLVGAPAPHEDAAGFLLAMQWLRSCRFDPAMNKARDPVAVRVGLPFLFHDDLAQAAPDNSLPLADGANTPIPQPTSNCDSHPWPLAPPPMVYELERGRVSDDEHNRGHGPPPIEVEYTVDTNGTASNVLLRSPSRRDVFHAARRYLLGCQFMAVHDETGQPISVRVRRSFNLQVVSRNTALPGGVESIVEGDPP